jgi:hypothetical protein
MITNTIIIKSVNDSELIVTNTRGIIYGHFVNQRVNEDKNAFEWVFYPLKNVYIKEYALAEILESLKSINTFNKKDTIGGYDLK